MPTHPIPDSQAVIYECENCEHIVKADSPFEADKPNGFWIDVRKVTGDRYRYHEKTPEPVFYCTKECLVSAVQFSIGHIVQPTEPIGLAASQRSPWVGSGRRQ